MDRIVMYRTKECPRCHQAEAFIRRAGLEVESIYLDDPAALAEARCNGVFGVEMPILIIKGVQVHPPVIFKGDRLDEGSLRKLLEVELAFWLPVKGPKD